jgi:DNA-binding NarL/FixJ family response regulator
VLATVKSHVTHILGKLSAANRTQAVTRAPRAGPADLMAAVRLIAKVAS